MAAADPIFAEGFKTTPYWWEAADPRLTELPKHEMPERVDVAVIGGGYTGLSCALELARSGVKVLVLDREAIGWGASSRNGGNLSGGLNLGRGGDPEKRIGKDAFGQLMEEAAVSFAHLQQIIAREKIDCHLDLCGRFTGAHSEKSLDELKLRAERVNRVTPGEAEIVARADVEGELATKKYFGGIRLKNGASLHPAKYVRGLAQAAARAGALLVSPVEVRAVHRHTGDGPRFTLDTSRGTVQARDVVVGTNGYTGRATPWHQRRVIPIASFMIATEEIGHDRIRRNMPRERVYGDTKRILYYFRPSPDRTRILFGGRASFRQLKEHQSGAALHHYLTGLLPDLKGVRITHAWKGNVAFTFDHLPHIAEQDGLHSAMGCNGSGVVMMSYLGHQVALNITGKANRRSAFGQIKFPTNPLYTGDPWFMPFIGEYFRLRDRMDGWKPGD